MCFDVFREIVWLSFLIMYELWEIYKDQYWDHCYLFSCTTWMMLVQPVSSIMRLWVGSQIIDICLICRWLWNQAIHAVLPEAVLLVQTQKALRWSELSVRCRGERHSWWRWMCWARFPRVQRERSNSVNFHSCFRMFFCCFSSCMVSK